MVSTFISSFYTNVIIHISSTSVGRTVVLLRPTKLTALCIQALKQPWPTGEKWPVDHFTSRGAHGATGAASTGSLLSPGSDTGRSMRGTTEISGVWSASCRRRCVQQVNSELPKFQNVTKHAEKHGHALCHIKIKLLSLSKDYAENVKLSYPRISLANVGKYLKFMTSK